MVKVEIATELQAIRDQLSGLDPHFASTRFKLFVSQVRTTQGSQVLSLLDCTEIAPY